LDIDDRLGASEAGLQASILLAQLVKLVTEELARGGFGAAALRGCKLALVTKFAPLGDLGGVDPLAAEQSAALGGATRSSFVGLKDAEFLSSAARAALRSGHNLRRARVRGAWSVAVAAG
jgi:hypothetical protein